MKRSLSPKELCHGVRVTSARFVTSITHLALFIVDSGDHAKNHTDAVVQPTQEKQESTSTELSRSCLNDETEPFAIIIIQVQDSTQVPCLVANDSFNNLPLARSGTKSDLLSVYRASMIALSFATCRLVYIVS